MADASQVELTTPTIDVSTLTSVADDSKTTAGDIIDLGNTMIKQFPNGLSLDSIVPAAVQIMDLIKKQKGLSMDQKKQVIVDVLVYVVDHTDSGALESLDPVIKQAIPSVLDAVFQARARCPCW